MKQKTKKGMGFVKALIKNPKATGALVPSSDELARRMCNAAQLQNAKIIVELGTGTGVVTKEIIKQVNNDALIIALEIDKDLAKLTKEQCPGVHVYADGAEHLDIYLSKHQIPKCDRIISGIPFANFSRTARKKILDQITNNLGQGGIFVTFAYLHGSLLPTGVGFYNELKENFSEVTKTKMVWGNLPPAFVYVARK